MLFLSLFVLGLGGAVLATDARAAVEDLEVGGFFAQDWISWGDVDTCLGIGSDDGTEARSARVAVKGKLAEHLKFTADYDLAGGDAALTDAYIDVLGLPGVGNARAGYMNEPSGLDQLTSTKFITFMERGSCTVFVPARNSGLMLWNTFAGGRLTVEAGGFRDSDAFGEGVGSGEGTGVTGRVTGLVVNADEGRKLVQLAASASMRNPSGDVVRYKARPEVHMGDNLVDTGEIPAESVMVLGVELGGVFGPAHFQGEYIMANITSPEEAVGGERGREAAADPGLCGYYAQAGYFLTGEPRGYKGTTFGRTKVKSDLLTDGGLGAVELAARYSSLDLFDEDALVFGGKMDDVTVGLNWYMCSNARLMVNYLMASLKDKEGEEVGTASALTTRLQFDF